MLFIKQSDTLFAANPSLSRLNSVSLDFRCRNNNSKELHTWVLYLQVPFLLQTVLVGADSVVATVFALHFFCPYQTMRLTCRHFSADFVVSSLAPHPLVDKTAAEC